MKKQRYSGRVGLITGASRGIGRALAKRFAVEGALLALAVRDPAISVALLQELDLDAKSVQILVGDLTGRDCATRMARMVEDRFGRLDFLIANAGELGPVRPLAQLDDESWEHTLDLNLSANLRLLRAFDPLLRKSPAARVVFVTSGAARGAGRPNLGAYAITKAALEAMARTYAAETCGTSILINLVNPGPTRTGMRASLFPDESPLSVKPPEAVCDTFVELCAAECQRSGEIVNAFQQP